MTTAISKTGEFTEARDGIAYGWCVISSEGGRIHVDTQGDHTPAETLASTAAEFMLSHGAGGKDNHEGDTIADVPFLFPIDGTVDKGIGLSNAKNRTGLVIGWRPRDPALLDKIRLRLQHVRFFSVTAQMSTTTPIRGSSTG